ncbi:Acetyl esterase/lipase [Klenkia soli]|uniref:Acetyl esterase/lipase n=1 Tax=Klenkia soli TaxID=1052260 RepID=A0A1H0L2M2_9ACTN|nr:alpha/beta hydrolase [Klenkia soli]SDO62325.1 Acetyl esterase/lipase [Klenkia soli]
MTPPPPAHTAPLPPARTTADGVRVLAGVPYAALPGARPLELDLHLPAHPGHAPVVVFLHGGGWRLGSRHSAGPSFTGSEPFEQLAAAGIAVASVDYRLSGEAVWPAQLHDAKAAVRWLRSRADELGIDPDRIAAWGESAGGHLAALLGLTGGEWDGEVGVTGVPSTVCAVVAWYPPTELATVADPGDPASREAQLLGAPPAADPVRAVQASPVSHVTPTAPPFLLLHGDADRLVPHDQSVRLAQLLPDVEFETLTGADHMWLGSPDAAATALARTTTFLTQHLIGDQQ